MKRRFVGRPSYRQFGRSVDRTRAVNVAARPMRGGFRI